MTERDAFAALSLAGLFEYELGRDDGRAEALAEVERLHEGFRRILAVANKPVTVDDERARYREIVRIAREYSAPPPAQDALVGELLAGLEGRTHG